MFVKASKISAKAKKNNNNWTVGFIHIFFQ